MIIISRALVLAAPASVPLDTPLIGWRNIVTASILAASSADAAFPAANLANPSTALKWKAVTTAAQTLTVSPGDAEPIDYVGIARHNLGTLQVPVTLEGRRASGDAFEFISELVPADDAPLIFRFVSQSFHELRLSIAAASAVASIAVLHVGALTVFPRSVEADFTPLRFGRESNVVTGLSESGNFLGRVVTGGQTVSVARFDHLTPEFYRTSLDPFVAVADTTAFFFAWSPSDSPKDVGYAWANNSPKPVWDIDELLSIEFQMTGIV